MHTISLTEALPKDLDPATVAQASALWPSVEQAIVLLEVASTTTITISFGGVLFRPSGAVPERIIPDVEASCTAARDCYLGPLGQVRVTAAPNGVPNASLQACEATCRTVEHILVRFLRPSLVLHQSAISMAHELSVMLVGLGLFVREFGVRLEPLIGSSSVPASVLEAVEVGPSIVSECQLGLFVARNFLSHLSPDRYRSVVRRRLIRVDLDQLLHEVLNLHRPAASLRGIAIDTEMLSKLPSIVGDPMELRRAFHNLVANAIKYSYRSNEASGVKRAIRVRSRDPYDPGFRVYRVAIEIENYGLGLSKDELPLAGTPGFRGNQAIEEVPIGSGIGLSEVRKIAAMHQGEFKLRSEIVHAPEQTSPTVA